MARSSFGLALLLLAPAMVATAQPRQPRVRAGDDSGSAPTSSSTTATIDPVATSVAATATADASAPPTMADDAPVAPATDASETPRIRQHDIGIGYRSIFVASSNGTRYLIHGPTVAYNYFVGRRWGFMLHAEASFPIAGHMGGSAGQFSGGFTDLYDQRRYSFDGTFMAARRFVITDRLILTAGVGLHVQSFLLKSVAYLPVEAITGGVGGLARIEWLANEHLSVGGTFATALDPVDFVRHVNRAALTMPLSAVVTLGLRY